jgi:hypothetical protein
MPAVGVTRLRYALEACGVHIDLIPQTISRLRYPPISLHISAQAGPEIGLPFDKDDAAELFQHGATWANLPPEKRKSAKRFWDWAVNKPDGLNVVPRGRPTEIDSALVLWCSRVLAEANGRVKYARQWQGGRPRSLDAFMVLLRTSQHSLKQRSGSGETAHIDEPRHAEAIVQILKLDRHSGNNPSAKIFGSISRSLGLGTTADDVAAHPQTFRYAVMKARVQRHRTRSRRPRQTGHFSTPD